MRYLHPVAHHEKFIASGVYAVQAPTDAGQEIATEEWSIHLQPGDSRFIRIDYTPAELSREHLLAEVLQSPDGVVERVDLVWFRQAVTRRISLTIFDTYIQIGAKIGAGERQYSEYEIPAGALLLPPFVLFTLGSVGMAETVTRGQWVGLDTEIAALSTFPPQMIIRDIHWLAGEIETLTIGRRQITVQRFNYQDGDTEVSVWRDQRMHLPVRVAVRGADARQADARQPDAPTDAQQQPVLFKSGGLRGIAY